MIRRPPRSTLFPTRRSSDLAGVTWTGAGENIGEGGPVPNRTAAIAQMALALTQGMLNEQPPDDGHRKNILDRKSTRLNSSHSQISYAVFCLKKNIIINCPAP